MSARPRDVAILGAGMAGLAAAWRLTSPRTAGEVGRVTVYQRGWRIGGKGASSRGPHGRIEEHGLHVWLGYYDNAFRMVRECYAELDRPRTDPDCPIRTWRDAFAPAPLIGIEDHHHDDWQSWVAQFSPNELVPGEPVERVGPMTVAELILRSLNLLDDFASSLDADTPCAARFVAGAPRLAIGALLELVGLAREGASRLTLGGGALLGPIDELRRALMADATSDPRSRRMWHLIDIVTVHLRGIVVDRLPTRGFRSIDHLEYRDWMRRHGAAPETLESALVRGMYGLAFSHRGGDPRETAFPAGLGLFLASKMFFDYKGALFWKMQAGMGDVVMAPLYQALRARGVDFEFFTRIDDVGLSDDKRRVETITVTHQAELAGHRPRYEPLVDVGGLPCFPPRPLADQLASTPPPAHCLESVWGDHEGTGRQTLQRGRDFDEVVFAIPPSMARLVCPELIGHDHRWAAMIDGLGAVATQAFQLWLLPSEEELGWRHTGSTVTGYVDSYDTWASMSHLVDVEDWPDDDRPGTIGYFCSSMQTEPVDLSDPTTRARARALARAHALEYLSNHVGHYWPAAIAPDGGFRWEILAGRGGVTGEAALDTQHITANVDPSELYVQALPGTDHLRLRPDDSGFEHLHLAGDWTDSGLNAGCVEAAVLSGLQAANSVLGRARTDGITGRYLFEPPGRVGVTGRSAGSRPRPTDR